MNTRLLVAIAAAIFSCAAVAQDAGSAATAGQSPNSNNSGGYGRRGGRGGMGPGGGMGMMGRGLVGTVTDAAADHYTIKTEAGDLYTVHFDANTRIVKQPAAGGMFGPGSRGQGGGREQGIGAGAGRIPLEQIKAADIKAGDMIRAAGDVDATAKTVTARSVMKLDPATVAQMREMESNFGKTWLAGKVTAIDGVKITLTGSLDNSLHTVVADENTEFRRRRDPITLADIHVGDTVRVEGATKDGNFSATSVNLAGMRSEGEGPGGPVGAPPQ